MSESEPELVKCLHVKMHVFIYSSLFIRCMTAVFFPVTHSLLPPQMLSDEAAHELYACTAPDQQTLSSPLKAPTVTDYHENASGLFVLNIDCRPVRLNQHHRIQSFIFQTPTAGDRSPVGVETGGRCVEQTRWRPPEACCF